MEERILESILWRPGMDGKEELLKDMIRDSMSDMRNLINYKDDERIPDGCESAVKELTLIQFNRDGVEGIQSESHSGGGSTSYTDSLPDRVMRVVRRYRRLRR